MGLKWLVLLAVVLFVGAAVVLGAANILSASAAAPAVREYTIKATQFAYEPNIIQVNRGDRVIFHVESVDVSHGLYLDGYDVNVHVPPGKPETVEFVADKVGTYRFRCSTTCGPMHPFMIGELKVEPNSPFRGAAALAVIAGLGTVVYTFRRKEGTHGQAS